MVMAARRRHARHRHAMRRDFDFASHMEMLADAGGLNSDEWKSTEGTMERLKRGWPLLMEVGHSLAHSVSGVVGYHGPDHARRKERTS